MLACCREGSVPFPTHHPCGKEPCVAQGEFLQPLLCKAAGEESFLWRAQCGNLPLPQLFITFKCVLRVLYRNLNLAPGIWGSQLDCRRLGVRMLENCSAKGSRNRCSSYVHPWSGMEISQRIFVRRNGNKSSEYSFTSLLFIKSAYSILLTTAGF